MRLNNYARNTLYSSCTTHISLAHAWYLHVHVVMYMYIEHTVHVFQPLFLHVECCICISLDDLVKEQGC